MGKRKSLNILILVLVVASLLFNGSIPVRAQDPPTGTPTPGHTNTPGGMPGMTPESMAKNRITPAMRKAAAERAAALRQSVADSAATSQKGTTPQTTGAKTNAVPGPGGTPDYFGTTPNYANSPLPTVDAVTGAVSGGIRKFVDSLPGLTAANKNDLGQYLPVAVADTATYPGSDYYEISLVEYTEQLHADLPPTRLRGYMQTNTTDPTVRNKPHYLGPIIVAQKDRPVRVKFTNKLPIGAGGDLFLPVDTTIMGAGTGPNGGTELYKQNRATLHLHGGINPWISDGTPHQWTTPAGETTSYPEGVSVSNVPDMPDPGPGSLTFFYSNEQSARLMFYHDHAYGITRLNVYGGEAAGYVLRDQVEQQLIASGVIPSAEVPLIIQDKTFVPGPAQLAAQDPTWDTAKWGGLGNLWMPHVFMPNQNPYDLSGANAMGRWDYGAWFWPPYTGLINGPVDNPYYDPVNAPWEPEKIPGTPNPSIVPEGFMDTPLVNGTAYPYVTVQPKAYRFRILNAANDRFWNLGLYQAQSNAQMWNTDASGKPTTLRDGNAGEVKMVDAVKTAGFPDTWPTDGRDGGVPDPAARGPEMIQIGTEGGFLPAPAVIPNQPVGYNYNRRDIVVLNVQDKGLFLGPAERADVIVDFSQYAGKTLILYNDGPAPVPAFDPRYDYYTGSPDMTDTGGAPSTLPGYGPNTRTIMQIRVAPAPVAPAFDLTKLNNAFKSTATTTGVFAASQNPIVVPQAAYNSAYNASYPADAFVRIQDHYMTFKPAGSATPLTMTLTPKAIIEEWEPYYGRMYASLGVELPYTNVRNQTSIPYWYIDPPTETMQDSMTPLSPVAGDGTQIWKITHNGVDTHAIHFHLFDVQLVNRVGWDGAIRPPDPNELGWKDTVRMNPLEDTIVAMRPIAPKLPFGLPDSIRPLDVTQPLGSPMGFTNIDPLTGNPITVLNKLFNFGWEFVWHCHLLGHEENDMMRPIVFNVQTVLPAAPVVTSSWPAGGPITLTWTDGTPGSAPSTWGNPANEVGYRVERALRGPSGQFGVYWPAGNVLANQTSFTDTKVMPGAVYSYRVTAFNAAGDSPSTLIVGGALPDLTPTTFIAPATAKPGQTIPITWTIKNQATGATGPTFEDRVYQSTDNVFDSGDTFLTKAARTTPLTAGGSYTVTANIQLTKTTGTSYLILKTDMWDTIAETDETNNQQVVPIAVIAPDLTPTAVTAPVNAEPRQTVATTWTVTNQGADDAKPNWEDRVYFSTDAVYDAADNFITKVTHTTPLGVGGSYTVTADVPLPRAMGTYYLIFITDMWSQLVETDETNNQKVVPITVTLPDLTPTAFTTPATAKPGQTIPITWTVKNQGAVEASPNWEDRVYLSADNTFGAGDIFMVKTTQTAPVAAGGSYTMSANVIVPLLTGNYYLVLVTDMWSQVAETNETNNQQAVPITIAP